MQIRNHVNHINIICKQWHLMFCLNRLDSAWMSSIRLFTLTTTSLIRLHVRGQAWGFCFSMRCQECGHSFLCVKCQVCPPSPLLPHWYVVRALLWGSDLHLLWNAGWRSCIQYNTCHLVVGWKRQKGALLCLGQGIPSIITDQLVICECVKSGFECVFEEPGHIWALGPSQEFNLWLGGKHVRGWEKTGNTRFVFLLHSVNVNFLV